MGWNFSIPKRILQPLEVAYSSEVKREALIWMRKKPWNGDYRRTTRKLYASASSPAPGSEISSGMPDPTSGIEELNHRALGAGGRSWLRAPSHPVQVPYDGTFCAGLQCLLEARLPSALSLLPGFLPAPPGVWLPVRRAGQLPPEPPPCRTPSGSSCTCRTALRRSWDQ